MCGFIGIFGDGAREKQKIAQSMIELLHHRGPDSTGLQMFDKAVLGHARLKIQDLSNSANQPMRSRNGHFWAVYNGEIYNFHELRRSLAPFYDFKTQSDTEVLIAAWERWGEDSLDQIKGMFAFCIYENEKGTITLVRDRYGQKPLFYARQRNFLIVASEIKPITAFGVRPEAAEDIWSRYLLEANYDDTRGSFFKGINQLYPGEIIKFDRSLQAFSRYYYQLADSQISINRDDLEKASSLVRDTMVNVCDMHMRSDVPVGVMLSGGLDSSSMLAALQLKGHLGNGLKSFSVDFGSSFTERPWIEQAVKPYDIESNISTFTNKEFLESIKPMMWHLEGPIGGLMNCALTSVMREAKKSDITVLLDGTGPDEAFGGYRNHHNLYLSFLLNSSSEDADYHIKNYGDIWETDYESAKQAALREAELHVKNTAIDGTVPVQHDCLNIGLEDMKPAETIYTKQTGDLVSDSLIRYISGSKILRNNRFLDRVSMAHSIELRLPFLEDEFIELGINLPNSWYFLDGYTKGIIRKAFDGCMPDSVRLAKKRSIQAPQSVWLAEKPMTEYIWDVLHSTSFSSRGYFNVKECIKKYRGFLDGQFDNSFFVWQWINLEEWHQVFIDADSTRHRHPMRTEGTT